MASAFDDRVYFPSLEECLTGEGVLLSWKFIAEALSDESGQRQTTPVVVDFIRDKYVQDLLSHPGKPFGAPAEASRKEYETKTAPIHATPDPSGRFDVTTLKKDAAWLSDNAQVNLVAALRVVAIEHQSRASSYLRTHLSTQDATNLQEAAGLSNGKGSSFMVDLGSGDALDAEDISREFETDANRRQRLFATHLEERRHFLMTCDITRSLGLYGHLPSLTPSMSRLAETYELSGTSKTKDVRERTILAFLQAFADSMAKLDSPQKPFTDEVNLTAELEMEWARCFVSTAAHALSAVLQTIDSFKGEYPSATIVNQWFTSMAQNSFLDHFQPTDARLMELTKILRAFSAVISLALLNPERSIAYLVQRDEDKAYIEDDVYDSYLLSQDILEQVHATITDAFQSQSDTAAPAILVWAMILHRMNISHQTRTERRDNLLHQRARETFEASSEIRPATGRRNSAGSIFSIESSKFDGFLETVSQAKDAGLAMQMAASVTAQGKVYHIMDSIMAASGSTLNGGLTMLLSSRIRKPLLELLRVSYPIVGYQAEPLSSLISMISEGRTYWDLSRTEEPLEFDIRSLVLGDDDIMELYFRQALERFPYEFMPLISLCRALCDTSAKMNEEKSELILNVLRRTPRLTLQLPGTFQDYNLVDEDESANTFTLHQEIELITLAPSRHKRSMGGDAYIIPAGTTGRFITTTGRLVTLDFLHSSLALLGRQLEVSLAKEHYDSEIGFFGTEEMIETISLLASLVRTERLKASGRSSGAALTLADDDVLTEASQFLSPGKDIVIVVCEAMDACMQDERCGVDETSVKLLTSCIEFLDAVLPAYPVLVWSYMGRSELLGSNSRAGKVTKITGSLEMIPEKLAFLKSALLFFSNLVDTAAASAVQRRADASTSSRQKLEANPWAGVTDKALSTVNFSIAQTLVDVLESTSTWRFESETAHISLLHTVIPVLSKIIKSSYDIGGPNDKDGLASSLRPAASYIVDCFTSPATGSLRFQPILASFTMAVTASSPSFCPTRQQLHREQVVSVLYFCTLLLRAADYLGQASSLIQTYLFKCSTLLARLCSVSELFKKPVLDLLETLVISAGREEADPPSLLGYLGPQVAKAFLRQLSGLATPLAPESDIRTTWRFFASILKNRQQWMSSCLLTGETPREAMKKKVKAQEPRADSVLSIALGKLKTLNTLTPLEALAVLDFVASAQNHWPWTVFTIQANTDYIQGMQAFVRQLPPSNVTAKSDPVLAGQQAKSAAYVAEILAMQLYHSRHLGNSEKLGRDLLDSLDYYLRDGTEVSGYNKSLHRNFEKNFSDIFFGCPLRNFRRNEIEPEGLGTHYFYNVDRAQQMLEFDPSWIGRKKDGFKAEMERANMNLSLIDAKIALFHGWEFLLLELSTCLPKDDTVTKQTLQVAIQCLNANQVLPGPESIFQELLGIRADLALVLIQRLVKESLPIQAITHILGSLVDTIIAVDEPFAEDSVSYYRTLMKTLFVTLRAYQQADTSSSANDQMDSEGTLVSTAQTVLNLLDRVVGRGFRTLISLIHDGNKTVGSGDLSLLVAVLQACLSLPTMENSQTQVLNIMASHDAVHAATSLFSWADKLTEGGDPVYGELSVLFLLELSTLPMGAEQLACDGILGTLLSTNILKFMLKSNVSPHAESPVGQRCYAIWVKGLLPLMLNLLSSLGATIAPEIAYVMNQFPHMLSRSIDRFDAPGASRTKSASSEYITLLGTSEIHNIALITRIVGALRVNNSRDIPEIRWDAASLLENLEYWLSSKKLLRERLLAQGERQVQWRNTRTKSPAGDSNQAENLLEEKVVTQLEIVHDVLKEVLDD